MSIQRGLLAVVAFIAFGTFLGFGILQLVNTKDKLEFQKIELKSKSVEIKQLDTKYDELIKNLREAESKKDTSQEEMKKLQDEKTKLEDEKRKLEAELQAKLETKSRLAKASEKTINTLTGTATASAATAPIAMDCNAPANAKQFIYCKESTNTADKWNHIGCYGLGQDCNGIVYTKCGADYACQDNFFTDYMQRRYGSWEKAKAFWLARVPINGKDVGNWW